MSSSKSASRYDGFKSFQRGHPIQYDATANAWHYIAADGTRDEVAVDGQPPRACATCQMDPTPEGHDPCLGTIAGAKNACCGHGDPLYAYVAWDDSRPTVRFYDALDLFARLGVGPQNDREPRSGGSAAGFGASRVTGGSGPVEVSRLHDKQTPVEAAVRGNPQQESTR